MAPIPYPAGERGTNGFAIASLILGIAGFLVIVGPVLAIAFGIVALSQIKTTAQKGRGMAIAGIALGSAWLVVVAFVVAVGVASEPKRDSAGDITKGGDVSVFSLRVGDCVKSFDPAKELDKLAGNDSEYKSLPVVPCANPHRAEVVASLALSGNRLPDHAEMVERAQQCSEEFQRYAPTAHRSDPSIELSYLYPNADAWKRGVRSITCLAAFGSDRTGSIRGR